MLRAIQEARPETAIVLGSGLGAVAEAFGIECEVPYDQVPGLSASTVPGHAGRFVLGRQNGSPILLAQGRRHLYEGLSAHEVTASIRFMHEIGVRRVVLTNAAGAIHDSFHVGGLMLITDHINFLGLNPLVGPNDEAFGPRFFPVADAWDPALGAKIKEVAQQQGVTLHEGVYVAFRGPSFETPAEIRMVQGWGGDAVGMSSVPDCLIARHCGMKVAGVSCITNMGAGLSDEKLSHAHTLENAAKGAGAFEKLVLAAVKVL